MLLKLEYPTVESNTYCGGVFVLTNVFELEYHSGEGGFYAKLAGHKVYIYSSIHVVLSGQFTVEV